MIRPIGTLARSRQLRAAALASLLLLVVIGALVLGIFSSRQQSRSHLAATFDLKGPSAASFLSTYVAQQGEREQQTAMRFLATRSVSSRQFELIASTFGSGAALLLDGGGRVLRVAPTDRKLIGQPIATRYSHLAAAEQGRITVSNVVSSAVKGTGVIAIAVPFSTPYGRRVFSAAYPLSESVLAAFVAHIVAYPQHQVYLVDASGHLIAGSPRPSARTIDQADPDLARAAARSPAGTVSGAREPTTFTSASVPGTTWRLLIAVPDSKLYSSISGLPQAIPWMVLALVTVLGSWLVALFGRSLIARGRVVTQAAIVQTMTEGVVLVSTDGASVLYTNPSLDAMMECRRGELIGHPWAFVNGLTQDDSRAMVAEVAFTLSCNRAWHGEIQSLRGDRSTLWCSVNVTALDHPDFGAVWMAVYSDISERKQAETDAEQALIKAVEASRAKSDFVASMSHEIRTPLNGVIGMADLLRDSQLTAAQREQVEALAASGDALLSVVGDVLDFSKIEAGRLELDPTDFDLRSAVNESCQLLTKAAEDKGLKIGHRLDPDVPSVVTGDRARLRQVLLNLLSNAVKFTADGEIAVHVRKLGDDKLYFAVSDSGIGIDGDRTSSLFDPFVQADQSTTREYGGTGLGLAISTRLVELLGGEIGAESRDAGGSVFWFTATLPAPPPAAALSEGAGHELVFARPPIDAGLLVLVAEDNEINRKVTQAHLQKMGLRTAIAHNGREAVEMAAGYDYAAILMDCQMPEVDGFDAARKIRERENGRRVPIIAMTALTMPGDRERCMAAGMDGYLSKPVRGHELSAVMQRWLHPKAGAGESPQEPRASASNGSTAVADDVLDAATVAQLVETLDLQTRGHLLEIFENQWEKCLGDLVEALSRGDHGAVRQVAHMLKGSAAVLGADALRRRCQELEHRGRDEDPGIGASELDLIRATAIEAQAALRRALSVRDRA